MLFSLNGNKAPGPNGYNAQFFKDAWPIIGDSVISAISHFFKTSYMDRVANATKLSLIPKRTNPTHMRDYRSIACCTTIYKCTAKILANQMRIVLPELISPNQVAFVAGRSISDNILLAHELVQNYHRSGVSPRSAIKIDLYKVFDSLDWQFILNLLQVVGSLEKFIHWIKGCLCSPWFSISINESLARSLVGLGK